jgi:hypothetical protein
LKNAFFGRLRPVQGCTDVLDGCKPMNMGANRKPRFSVGDVEKAMACFFNGLPEPVSK